MQNDQQAARKAAVYEAALQLIGQGVSPAALKIQQLADAAGIGKGTVYEYFSSKEEILQGLAEYCFAVPANRFGHEVYNAAELKTMQEVITLTVFAFFSVFYLGERLTLNHLVGFGFIGLGAFFVFKGPLH